MSERQSQWAIFANLVGKHIDKYTVPQYGDYPNDQATTFTDEEIISQFKRYVNRLNSNARGPEEAERDLFKIAHYAALLHFKRYHHRYHSCDCETPCKSCSCEND